MGGVGGGRGANSDDENATIDMARVLLEQHPTLLVYDTPVQTQNGSYYETHREFKYRRLYLS